MVDLKQKKSFKATEDTGVCLLFSFLGPQYC